MGLVTAKGFSKLTAKPREVAQAETHQGFSEGHFDQKPSIAQSAIDYVKSKDPRVVRLVGFFTILFLSSLLSFLRFRRYVMKKAKEIEVLQAQRNRELEANKHLIFAKRQEVFTIIGNNIDLLFTNRLRVSNLMTQQVHSISVDATTAETAEAMRTKCVGHLMVCDDQERLVGLISFGACVQTSENYIRDVMITSPTTVTPDAMLSAVSTLMVEKKISAVPVVEHERLVGVLTRSDVIVAFQASLQIVQKYFLDNDIDLPEYNRATSITELAAAE